MSVKHGLFLCLIFFFSCEDACNSGLGGKCQENPNDHEILGGSECEEGLVCHDQECVAVVGIGHACDCWEVEREGYYDLEKYEACAGICSKSFCETRIETPVCRPYLKENKRCDSDFLSSKCAIHLTCNEGFDPPSCQSLQPYGGRCGEDSDCQSRDSCPMLCEQRRCIEQKCMPLDMGTGDGASNK